MIPIIFITIAALAAGFIAGFFLCMKLVYKDFYGGVFKWQRDEDGVYPYVEGNKPLESIAQGGWVLFKVARD